MKTKLLNSLYEKYKIKDLQFGEINDKLGDVYEQFCVEILKSKDILDSIKSNSNTASLSLEESIMISILNKSDITDYSTIKTIEADTNIPSLKSGGNPKTDIHATVSFRNGENKTITISCKQSTVTNVALAEFDIDTICEGVGINVQELKGLMLKHQVDASAKNFTKAEKDRLKELLKPKAREFVRWVVTGSKDQNANSVQIPKIVIKFKLSPPQDKNRINILNGDYDFMSFEVITTEEYIDLIMCNSNGSPRKAGFGTGLSWTYATGSKGKKIQFKGKV